MYYKINELYILCLLNRFYVVLDFYCFYNIGCCLLYICVGCWDNIWNSLVYGIFWCKRIRMLELY